MPSETVITLRKQLREKFPSAHNMEKGFSSPSPPPRREATPTSLSSIASATGEALAKGDHSPAPHPVPHRFSDGGSLGEAGALACPSKPWRNGDTWHFPQGAITEISPASPSCGLSLIVAALLAETETLKHRDTEAPAAPTAPLVLIDARDRFDPASFTPEECARLLWLRCRDTTQALRSADLLLRDGNLPFILLDLSALPARELRRIPNSSWHRLRQLAQSTDTTLLALTPTPLIPRTTLRLTLTRPFTLDDLHLSRPELLASLQSETTRHLHQTA